MAVVARSATQLTHTTPVTVVASPGVAANVPDGDTFPNGGSSILTMNNTGAAPYYVDVVVSSTVDGQPVTARRHTVPAGTIQRVLLGSPTYYGTVTKVIAENVAVKLMVETV